MLLFVAFSTMLTVEAAGPNYMGWVPTSTDVTVGDAFYKGIYFDVGREVDTITAKNNASQGGKAVTFLPAGVVNYTDTTKGPFFNDAYTVIWMKPTGAGDINNTNGWVKDLLWSVDAPGGGAVNNTNATGFNITWSAVKCGTVTLTIVGNGGTARAGIDPGTTIYAASTVRVHPQTPTDFTATMINEERIDLSWTKHIGDDKTLIRYKTGSNPISVTDGTEFYNGTDSSTSHTGLSGGDHIYYSAWGWNTTAGFYSLTYDTADDETNNAPVLTDEDPVDTTIDVDKNYPQVSVDISDADAEQMTWTIEVSNGDDDNGADYDGTITCDLVSPLNYGETYTWWVNVTDGYDWTNETYTFTVRNEFFADPPSGFTAITYDRFQINLTWTKGAGGDKTVIVAKLGSAPTGIGDGTIIYNGTGSGYNDGGLGPSEHWYYIAYSWNETDETYSISYVSADASTEGNTPPGPFSSEDPANESDYESVYNKWLNVTVTDTDGDGMTVYFYWGNHTSIAFDTIASGGTASIYLPDYINPDWLDHQNDYALYTWYAIANDTYDQTGSDIWNFITSYAWDVNEDRSVDYLDVSTIVGVYGSTVTAGSIGADVIEDGEINYLDASLFVSHYGESY